MNELDYITEELVDEYKQNDSREEEKSAGITKEMSRDLPDTQFTRGYGAYGNSLVFLNGKVKYKRNKKGTSNYGCGTQNWTWRSDRGDTFTPKGTCSGGRKMYLLYCPSC